jgi:glycosyltransferase involved in cell wall biosynthesis
MLARALARRGCRISVVGLAGGGQMPGEEDDEGVTVYRIPSDDRNFTGALNNALRLRRFLFQLASEKGLDIVEGPEQSLFGLWGRQSFVRIARLHGGHTFFADALGLAKLPSRVLLERNALANADYWIGVSAHVLQSTRRLFPFTGVSYCVIPNPVDVEKFCARATEEEEPGLILFVGSLTAKKGIMHLVRAFEGVHRQLPEVRLVLAGRDLGTQDSGRSFREVLPSLLTPESAERIEFVGAVPHDQLPPLLARAQLCVFPSLMEANALAPLEAMAMAKPVIGSSLGPGPEVIEDERTGLLCDPRNEEQLTSAMVRLMKDGALRSRLGFAAAEDVRRRFSLGALADANLEFYRICIRGGRRGM